MNLSTFEKKDSTGICFIGERPFPSFLENYIKDKPGKIICDKGNEVGLHRVFLLYLRSKTRIRNRWIEDYDERPWYVVEKKLSENILVVAQGNDNQNYLITNYLLILLIGSVNQI